MVTLVNVRENSKKLWKHSPRDPVFAAFLVVPNFRSCYDNFLETRKTFSFSCYVSVLRLKAFLPENSYRFCPFLSDNRYILATCLE